MRAFVSENRVHVRIHVVNIAESLFQFIELLNKAKPLSD